MLGAGAAAADTLVKNLGQTTSAAVANLSNRDLSQAFTTGSTADAYELTGVTVQFGTVPGSTATVTAFIADGQGTSDDIIANLTNPPTWTTTSTFTAPDGITLDANTTYHLIIEGTEGTLATTASDSEDSGGVTGWSIADAQTQRSMVSDSGLGGTWTIATNALKISVDGDHKGTVTACSVASMQNQVWTGTLTVGARTIPGIPITFYGWGDTFSFTGASLSDDEFTFDTDTYEIDEIFAPTPGALDLVFDSTNNGDIATQATRDSLILHVGNSSFNLGGGSLSADQRTIRLSIGLTWAKYDRICLALTEVDTTPPALDAALIFTANTLLVIYNEELDSTSVPDKSQLEVKVEGTARTVTAAALVPDNTAIRLTVSPAIRPGETVTISYTVPASNPIQDEAGNDAAAFTDLAVTNGLPATAPEAPGNLAATPGTVADTMVLTWDTPWANGRDITEFQAHHVAGSTAGGTWADILNSDADTTTHTVTGLTAGTQYTFEVRAVNGIGNGAPATVTQTTATPTWELTLTDNGNAVTELVEGGASATATVRITNGVTFGTAQTVTLEWDESPLNAASPIQGSGGASEITIPPGTSSGTLVISAPDPGGVAAYDLPRTAPLWGRHGENQISGIDLTFSDDEEPPVATLTAQPAQVSEGEAIEVEIRLSLAYGDNATSTLQLIVTDADGALVAPLPTEAQFDAGELTHAITLTAADNAVHNDGAREVTVALAPNPDAALYTLGEPSSATVVVTDNDNVAPVFSDGASATRSVAENTAAGENVGAALTATDTDAGDTLTYTLEGAGAASFDIVSTSGQIRTRSGVTYDHEAKSSYSVTVKADDGNAGTATIAVTITVTDVAEPPAAPAAPAVTATSGSTTSLDVTWTAPANPGKPAIGGYDLRYRAGTGGSWTDGPQNRTGASASIASLTAGTSYQVQVRATNAEGDGPWSASGTGSTGTPSNTAPTFANPTATRSVPENSAAGTNVGAVVTATDTDAGDTLTYTLEGADAASFDIVSTSGQIRTRSGVTYDHEAKSSYSVTVKADDGNAGNATTAVTITVTDVAEPPAAPAAPAVTATSASTTSLDVTWTAPANPGKPAISGYDLRYRAGISGSWTDGPQNSPGASASIASLTAGTPYQVQVRATNAEGDGPWSASGTGSTGTPSNAAPTFANPTATRSVPENSAAGTNVGAVVTATDTDAGDTLTYTLEGADTASFDIVSTSGQIRTRPGVTYDHEAKPSYSVTVKADDGNAGNATTAVTVTVTDVAEPPAAPAAPAVTATSASTTSLDVAWTAPANPGKPAISGYDLRYRAGTGGSWSAGRADRHGASASIASLTAGTSYQVQVRATNAEGDGPWSASGTGSTGTSSNAAPTFANPTATRSVPENSAAGTNVGAVVTATDTDAGDTLTYTLEGADAASFDIVSTSGQIRTRSGVTYDHEAKSSYSVTVKADDGNAGNATTAVTITVTDVAEPPAAPAAPAVTATSASTTSLDVTWTAPANPGKPAISGYDLRYRAGISGSWTDGPQNSPGASASIASLTAGTPYQVQVRATNAEGDGPWSASGTGSTGTPSNAAPTFANPTATRSVPENSAAGTNVGAVVTATDTDAGDTLTYTLEGADTASFDIVSTSGQIRTRPGVTYDHEAKPSYSVTVKADDGNAGNATTAVTVTVTDVAEPPAAPAAPAVTATSASTTSLDVAWTAPANPGKPAISGYDLRYRAGTGGSWSAGRADRHGASASIASLTAGTSYQVQVRATNAEGDGPWSASGTGSTGTSSNAAPTFANPTATRSVPENSAAGTNVGAVVTATDTDVGDTLTYTLEGADAASFDIVSTSGQIRTRPGVTYDHEARSSYSVTVKADDGNDGNATTAVTITVTDVAEPPAAPAAPTVTATSGSTTSLDVAWTAPANPGKPAISGYDLRYRAGTGGSWSAGRADRHGASASIASLTAGTPYQVQVRATNAEGDGPWSASGTGSTGTSSNTAPTFANPTATRSVPENSAAGTNVGAVVTATDTDAGDTLTYTLEGTDAASFDIVSTSGQIRTRPGVTYDHEAKSSYSVTVKADDGTAGTATTAVTITVTDVAEPPAAPTWELTLTDSNGNAVTELVEGGAPATATVSITNAVTFSTAQTVTLEWDASALDAASPIQGSGGASEITIPANQSSGSLVISAPDPGGVAAYTPPRSASVLGRHGATRIGGIDLAFRDDEEPPVATLTAAPARVSEGEGIEVEISLSLAYGDNATSTLQLVVTDADGALVAPLPTEVEFDPGELTHAITLTAADNAVHNDGARVVTVALAPNADVPYTLGDPSSVTVTVLDNDTPPATPMADAPDAPRSLTAEGGNQEVTLRWLAPASNGGSAILRYQYRQQYGSQAYGDWTDIANSAPGEANANSYTVTGLLGNAQYRFKVRAVNTGGPGAESNEVVETPVPVTKLRASQKAWMARFDRTVATQVVDAIGDRLSGGGTRGVTVGGQSLNRTGGAVDEALARDRLLGELGELGEPGAEPKVLSMTGRELLLGSSFSVGGGGKNGAPSWGAWGRFATGGFKADADGMRVEGDVTTGLLGADASRGRWLAGVAVSLSRGEGPFRLTSAMESNRRSGTVESSLTALYPYAKLGLSDRMEAWGMVGLGTGKLTVRESGGTPIETDLGMTMGAVGARGRLLSAGEGGGLDLALRSDAMWVRMKSDAVSNGEGNLAAAQALVSRLRLIVEGSRTFAMADERTITPRGEVGVRHDLGDAETGTGVEVGAGVKFAGDGFSIEGAVRALVAHEDAHYREWGASGAIRVDPGTAGRGLSLSIAPTWGNAASEAERLWSARDAGGLVRADDFEAKSRLEAELGYGVGAPRGPGLVTPYAGLTLSGGAPRALRTGVRWNASPGAAVSLEASREGQGSGEAPANALTLRAEARW